MKRFVSLILSVCFLFSINTVSYAANISSRKASNPVIQSMNDKYHVDFSGMSIDELNKFMGMFARSQSWLIWSKQPLMSPSKTHFGEMCLRDSALNRYSQASCAHLPFRKPKDFPSAVVSATGSSAKA